MRHIISILIENESGALSRVAGLFSARGYNIESLTVAPTEDPSLSRMTLVTRGSDDIIEQITKQLNKLIDVVKLIDLAESDHIERELMMVKVKTTEQIARRNQRHGGYISRQDYRCDADHLCRGNDRPLQQTGCVYRRYRWRYHY